MATENIPDLVITDVMTVSYTHLDVYKRQSKSSFFHIDRFYIIALLNTAGAKLNT